MARLGRANQRQKCSLIGGSGRGEFVPICDIGCDQHLNWDCVPFPAAVSANIGIINVTDNWHGQRSLPFAALLHHGSYQGISPRAIS